MGGEWHPSGKFLFALVEKAEIAPEPSHHRTPEDAIPGYGGYTDLWAVTLDGQKAWLLHETPNDYDHGIIHCAVSADGKQFAWTERVSARTSSTSTSQRARTSSRWPTSIEDPAEADQHPDLRAGGRSLGRRGGRDLQRWIDHRLLQHVQDEEPLRPRLYTLEIASGAIHELTHRELRAGAAVHAGMAAASCT